MQIKEALLNLGSNACSEYSGQFDSSTFDAIHTPLELKIELPAQLQTAVASRQAEFIAGRFAAFTALRRAGYLGVNELAIRSDRSPEWPPGFVGSITHSAGYVSAIVSNRSILRGIGHDIENVLSNKTALEIGPYVFTPTELQYHPERGYTFAEYMTLIFSAKESLFKAIAPIVKIFFDFKDVQVIGFSRTERRIRFRMKKDLGQGIGVGTEFDAKFLITEYVYSIVEINA